MLVLGKLTSSQHACNITWYRVVNIKGVEGGKEIAGVTYNTANLRGFNERTGNRTKQITKQAKAARLQPPKINIRSHLLTDMPNRISLAPSDPAKIRMTYAQTTLLPPPSSMVLAKVHLVTHV